MFGAGADKVRGFAANLANYTVLDETVELATDRAAAAASAERTARGVRARRRAARYLSPEPACRAG